MKAESDAGVPVRAGSGGTRIFWVVLLVLLVSHGLVYVWAKQRQVSLAEDGGAAAEAARPLPGKSVLREAGANGAGMNSAGFRRMLAELERPGTPYSAKEFEELRMELFREWIRRDLRSAMEVLFGPETAWRYEQVKNELYKDLSDEMAKHPLEVQGWIVMRRFGSHSAVVARHWTEALVTRGQVDAVLAGLKDLPASAFSECFIMTARRANAAQLATMRQMAAAMGPDAEKPELGLDTADIDGKAAYAERKVLLAKGDLAAVLEGEANPAIRELLLSRWVLAESTRWPPDQIAESMLKLPEAERAQAMDTMFSKPGRGGVRGVMDLLDALDSRGLLGAVAEGEALSPVLRAGLQRLDYTAMSREPADLLEAAQVIGRAELREQALGRILMNKGAIGEKLAAQLVDLPASRDRDFLLAGALRNAGCDPAAREILLQAIGDEGLREELRNFVPPGAR